MGNSAIYIDRDVPYELPFGYTVEKSEKDAFYEMGTLGLSSIADIRFFGLAEYRVRNPDIEPTDEVKIGDAENCLRALEEDGKIKGLSMKVADWLLEHAWRLSGDFKTKKLYFRTRCKNRTSQRCYCFIAWEKRTQSWYKGFSSSKNFFDEDTVFAIQ